MDYLNPPKWSERAPVYHESVLEYADKNPDTYTPPTYRPPKARPEFSDQTSQQVLDAIHHHGPLTAAEIADQTDRSHPHVYRVPRHLREWETVAYCDDVTPTLYAGTLTELAGVVLD